MSLINDALKEAKAQSAHTSLPPDLAEKFQEGGGVPPDPDSGDNNDYDENDSDRQKHAPKKKRKGGTGELAIFALIFLLLIGGLLTAGYFLFPDLAGKAGLAKKPDKQTQPPQEQATNNASALDNATAAPANEPITDRDPTTQPATKDTNIPDPDPDPEPETETATKTVPETSPKSSPANPNKSGVDSEVEATLENANLEPQPVETAAEEPESVDEDTPKNTKPQPAPPDMRRAFHLSAIVGTASRRMAVINGGIVQPGDTVNGITIVSISRRQLIVEKDGSQYILRPSAGDK